MYLFSDSDALMTALPPTSESGDVVADAGFSADPSLVSGPDALVASLFLSHGELVSTSDFLIDPHLFSTSDGTTAYLLLASLEGPRSLI